MDSVSDINVLMLVLPSVL